MDNTTDKESKLKVDFNLLMSGTWVLEKKREQKVHYFEKKVKDGKIVIYNPLRAPTPTDSKLLDYLMLKSQKLNWAKAITIPSINQVIEGLGLGRGSATVKRIKNSLKILENTHIEFHNCFIDTGASEYFSGYNQFVSISIISEYAVTPKVKGRLGRGNPLQVKVIFSDSFNALCKNSLGYKLVPYTPIQKLRDTPYALYKWAYRWYNSCKGSGERWIGDGQSLIKWYRNALNSVAKYRYPSEVSRAISSAVGQLNADDKIPFALKFEKDGDKYKLTMRAKGCVIKTKQSPYDSLPESDRNVLLSYVKDNRKDIKNPRGFLKSLSKKELDVFMRRVKGKKVLVSAGSKEPEREPEGQANSKYLRDKVAEVVRSFGLSDEALILDDNGMGYNLYLCGLTGKKIHELNTSSDFMDTLRKVTGKPVRVV